MKFVIFIYELRGSLRKLKSRFRSQMNYVVINVCIPNLFVIKENFYRILEERNKIIQFSTVHVNTVFLKKMYSRLNNFSLVVQIISFVRYYSIEN